jgi:hypothetical protein
MRLSECYTVPAHVARWMASYDSALRLRWDGHLGQVRVERKVRPHLNPAHFSRDPIGRRMALDGYDLITAFTPTEEAWAALPGALWHGDVWRRGGYRAVVQQDAETQQRGEAQRRAKVSHIMDALSREVARYFLRSHSRTLPEGAGWSYQRPL